jgi:hypothetical protein
MTAMQWTQEKNEVAEPTLKWFKALYAFNIGGSGYSNAGRQRGGNY